MLSRCIFIQRASVRDTIWVNVDLGAHLFRSTFWKRVYRHQLFLYMPVYLHFHYFNTQNVINEIFNLQNSLLAALLNSDVILQVVLAS